MNEITETELAEIDDLIGTPEAPRDHHDPVVDSRELASWLGITPNRVNVLGKDGVIPRTPDKRYYLRKSILAYCENARRGATGGRMDSELAAEKLRLAREQADKIAFANARARGELLDSREVATAWRGVVVDLRAALLAVSGRVAARLGMDREETAALDSEIRAAMEALAHDD